MTFDLVVRGGSVVDPGSGLRRPADVGIANGRVTAIDPGLPHDGEPVVDATGALVLPGLVDGHTHVYWGGTPLGVDPDVLAPASGVTTWIDTGSAGAGNLAGLVGHVIERSQLTIKAFVHLSYVGLVPAGHTELRFGELFDHRLADAKACLRALEEHAPHVLGVKLRIGASSTGPNAMDSLRLARSVADASGLRLMVHIADPPPLLADVLALLGEGDLLTHVFTPGLSGILDRTGRVRDEVWRARDRGVLFDLGHGSGSFSFAVARKALEQGFVPDILSSDLHAYNVDGPVFDLATTLTKFLALGLPLHAVLERATVIPGRLVDGEAGTLRVGGRADLAVVRIEERPIDLGDSRGEVVRHGRRLVVAHTILGGEPLLADPASRPQGQRKPGLPPTDPRLESASRRELPRTEA